MFRLINSDKGVVSINLLQPLKSSIVKLVKPDKCVIPVNS